jgi:hypothetical protein
MSVDLEEGENDTKIDFKVYCVCVCVVVEDACICVCVCVCVCARLLDVTRLGYVAVGFTGE